MRRRTLLLGSLGLTALSLPALAKTPELTADVVIVGSGGAGLMAAYGALEAGAKKIVVLEKAPMAGGRTAYSSGFLSAVSPKRQNPGVTDSVERMVRDMLEEGDYAADARLVETLARDSESVLDLFESLGLRWRPPVALCGGFFPRNFSPYPMRSGYEYVRALLDALEKEGDRFRILFETRAERLLAEDGRIAGIAAQGPSGPLTVRAKAVVLATGGFASNAERLARCLGTDPHRHPRIVSTPDPVDTGDGLDLAEAVGADAVGLEHVLAIPYMGGKIQWAGASDLYLDREGRRFIAEDASWRTLRNAVERLPDAQFWVVTDSQSFKGDSAEMKILEGRVRVAENLEALAKGLDVPLETLRETLARYNAFVREGIDRDFGKRSLLLTVEEPPFYYGEESLGVLVTLGGLAIDTEGRVLDKRGLPIPGLYAAGETTGGVHGASALGGTTLTEIFVFGRRAGREAARVSL